ncbi:aliphatic sulfonate ABC transporter substrate-binding protein [Methylobacterium haplocladii]|uniref:Putative aliphatic sulfonates-binding protein n=1 Tax=Methylobacterium haplocladii TaxID=1176176 RepID=A0A512IQK0_9HYPH|nr:aliphatic sulfonate ABC transporter substrate-binding protein [Methylobacterium haplocladii]GEO99960.1 sulfonate ABC transporter substrate-binding protein [Methylobacterium haplocladii]GJD84515.1 Putative aliphatic sulfonates-binding protein [Methylobacterium haplocladii]GLS61339.1 sulfonate ABC transporter substrate-binding protein [Methylobacterium haplocladii]
MITRRLAVAGALAAALPIPARAGDGAVLRVGYQKNGILAVAKEQGAIEARLKTLGVGVTWVEFSYGPPLLEALSLGSIDFGQTGDAPPIFAQAAKANLVYAAAQPNGGSGSAILLPKGSTIQSLADLKGRRVAFAKGSSAHNFTIAALEKAGLGYADIEPVTLAPADGAAAFARGAVDAWTVWDPYFAIAETGEGVRILAQASEITPTNNFFLANRTAIEANPERVTAAIEALGGVAAWCEANRGEVAKSLSRITGVPLPATERTVGRIRYVIAPMSAQVTAEQQRIADRFHGLKIIPRAIRVADIVWTPPGVPRSNG